MSLNLLENPPHVAATSKLLVQLIIGILITLLVVCLIAFLIYYFCSCLKRRSKIEEYDPLSQFYKESLPETSCLLDMKKLAPANSNG